jgi:hypothetical protein
VYKAVGAELVCANMYKFMCAHGLPCQKISVMVEAQGPVPCTNFDISGHWVPWTLVDGGRGVQVDDSRCHRLLMRMTINAGYTSMACRMDQQQGKPSLTCTFIACPATLRMCQTTTKYIGCWMLRRSSKPPRSLGGVPLSLVAAYLCDLEIILVVILLWQAVLDQIPWLGCRTLRHKGAPNCQPQSIL